MIYGGNMPSKMYWQYRVIRQKLLNGDLVYGIHEAYLEEGDSVKWISTEPCSPFGESLEELKKDHEMMMDAFNKPIIDYDSL
jgi:hypothetical protein